MGQFGSSLHSNEATRTQSITTVATWLVAESLATPSDGLYSAVASLLGKGDVSAAAEESCRQQPRRPLQSAEVAEALEAGDAMAADDNAAMEQLAPALLLLDPGLSQARFRSVPSRTTEARWWRTYLQCARCAVSQRLAAVKALALAAVGEPRGCGAFGELNGASLLQLAASLPDARSLLRLAATCRCLYPLSHAALPWEVQARRAFPDVLPADCADSAAGRRRCELIASGRVGGVAYWAKAAVHTSLCENWRTRTLSYGGWGAAHLEMRPLWRRHEQLAVEVEFEYKYDDGDAVWGGRATEQVHISHEGLGEVGWRARLVVSPLHGKYRGLEEISISLASPESEGCEEITKSAHLEVGVEMLNLNARITADCHV